ncbi:baseplate J/gp47 family protein [Candidatus Dojkabacteria bacterium]|uniref:Baseplate J/gp47 family protein n=1 Tax=Candidatus Dojkabacteria bacterium TaxID=2099670 RepID=A0A955KVG6_9BACT|nr:baseplate J/gp47 family protein [Candidatus Dojkabacteria bacterium]
MPDGKNNSYKKIVVQQNQELIDIVREIKNSKENRLIVVFAEESDLLISPVNFKVLQETADEENKALVFQIIQNPAGIRNAEKASVTILESLGNITEQMWQDIESSLDARRRDRERVLKGVNQKAGSVIIPQTPATESPSEEGNQPNDKNENKEPDKPISAFQKKIEDVLAKSKSELQHIKSKTIEQDGMLIALDHDIEEDSEVPPNQTEDKGMMAKTSTHDSSSNESLVGKNFKPEAPREVFTSNPHTTEQNAMKTKHFSPIPTDRKSPDKPKIKMSLNIFKKMNGKKVLLLFVLPLLVITAASLWAVYTYAPLVKVNIFIESRPVAAKEVFTGDPSTTEFNLEGSKLRVKKETISDETSDSAAATGVGSRGTKAGGIVTVKCFLDGATQIAAGTAIASEDNLSYTIVSDVSLECPTTTEATVEAADVGEEYNLASGTAFSVAGYTIDEINAVNDSASFSGGSKETFTVITQSDINNLAEKIKEAAAKDAENKLKELSNDEWEIIESTIKAGDNPTISSDFPSGAEVDIVNVTAKTSSTALYYNKKDLLDNADELLLKAAQDENLFESSKDLDLKLDKDIVTSVKVKSVKGSTVKVTITASGAVKPTVDKELIAKDLSGKNWDDGIKYLGDLSFVAQNTEVEFLPDYFPKSLRYFPNRQGRILITVKEVEPQVVEPTN